MSSPPRSTSDRAFCEIRDLLAGHDFSAVVIGEFADHADRRQSGEAAQIDRPPAWPERMRTPPSRAISGNTCPAARNRLRLIAVGERAHRIGALLRRNAGRQAVLDVDRKAVPSGASLAATIGCR